MNVLQLAPELSLVSVPQAGSMLFSRALPKLNMTSMCFCRVGSALARLEVLNNTARQYRQEVERLQEEVGKLQQVLSDVYITLLTPTMHKLPLKQINSCGIKKEMEANGCSSLFQVVVNLVDVNLLLCSNTRTSLSTLNRSALSVLTEYAEISVSFQI